MSRGPAGTEVDLANEAIQQVTARYDFAMNAQVVRIYSQMMKSLLDIKTWDQLLAVQ